MNALIGSTGFVGATLLRHREFDRTYHRPNVHGARHQCFERLVITAAPAQKWLANAEPEADRAGLEALMETLRTIVAREVVLISTIDVYDDPRAVDEGVTTRSEDHPQAYGRNRLALEEFVSQHYDGAVVLRLPGLFGSGLKKNLIFDLLHERPEEFVHRDSVFQFYDLSLLADDIDRVLAAGLTTVNLATEPLSAQRIALDVFARELHRLEGDPANYDMRTVHAQALGGRGPYLYDADAILDAMRAFVVSERAGLAS